MWLDFSYYGNNRPQAPPYPYHVMYNGGFPSTFPSIRSQVLVVSLLESPLMRHLKRCDVWLTKPGHTFFQIFLVFKLEHISGHK